MRIALISDIHGNLLALEAVLAELESEAIDEVVCLGDVVTFGPQPRQVLALLRKLACPVVMGNTDAWALDPQPFETRDKDSWRFYEVELWGARRLSPSDLDYVRSFRETVSIDLAKGVNLLCYHGSPQSHTDAILPTTPDHEVASMLSGFEAEVMAGGHTHAQMLRRFGEAVLLNPGSVGHAIVLDPSTREVDYPPWAEYALVSWEDDGLRIEFHRAAFNRAALVRTALTSGMPHADWWTMSRTGRRGSRD